MPSTGKWREKNCKKKHSQVNFLYGLNNARFWQPLDIIEQILTILPICSR
jgi:TRAP-type mannitol/chloroaromatic compound transport system permease small subunit